VTKSKRRLKEVEIWSKGGIRLMPHFPGILCGNGHGYHYGKRKIYLTGGDWNGTGHPGVD
jgi:hypothetical protein